MTQSMTGFASRIVEISLTGNAKISLAIYLKTLNARYFEINCKVPSLLNSIEVNIHRLLKKSLERGHVYIMIKVHHDMTQHSVIPNKFLIQEYMHAIEQIKKMCKIEEEVDLATLLRLPNIVQIEEELLDSAAEEQIVHALELLINDLIKTRKAEGKVLEQDITMHLKAIIKALHKTEKLAQKLFTTKKIEIAQLIEKLQGIDDKDFTIAQSLMQANKATLLLELEKIDIHEEITRATMHASNMLKFLSSNESVKGKKLDFTLQELNREVNTIASKCSNAQISSLTIDMKTDIEKAREQVQNIL